MVCSTDWRFTLDTLRGAGLDAGWLGTSARPHAGYSRTGTCVEGKGHICIHYHRPCRWAIKAVGGKNTGQEIESRCDRSIWETPGHLHGWMCCEHVSPYCRLVTCWDGEVETLRNDLSPPEPQQHNGQVLVERRPGSQTTTPPWYSPYRHF
ncbi:hypothetical protein J6590_004797 [Homalodisca vitripennis]|nr:hypothetical protein J6590_004797 [Homalodisca vitripennis]